MADGTTAELEGKIALVTGAGSHIGLGRAMALALLRAGARVAMCDIDQASLDQSVEDARSLVDDSRVLAIVADVANADDAARAVDTAIAELGGLHILVNNAGIAPRVDAFWDLRPEDWSRTIATNLSGPFFMARAAVQHLRQQAWGRIIGITTSLDTMLRQAPYGPSKAGHEALVAVIARQLEGSGVTANVLVPGRAVQTNMVPPGPDPRGQRLQPEVMQAPVVWLASVASDGVNGRRIVAEDWDEHLPIDQRLARASAPVGWPQLSRSR
jgi:3-oxoacyl-[acyl-carrier protein] reductase